LKRKWLLLFALFVAAVLVAGYLLIPVDEGRITQANYDKIQAGWSEKQVEDLLGRHSYWMSHDRMEFAPTESYRQLLVQDSNRFFWLGWSDEDQNEIMVGFNQDADKVSDKGFCPSPLTSWEKLKGRIKRRLKAVWP